MMEDKSTEEGKGLENLLILYCEGPSYLVQCLQHANDTEQHEIDN